MSASKAARGKPGTLLGAGEQSKHTPDGGHAATSPEQTKLCSKCNEYKSVTEFNKMRVAKDGLYPWCKKCLATYDKGRYRARYRNVDTRYAIYVKSARERGRSFSLTLEEFKEITSRPCHYCHRCTGTMGIDRVQNDLGYDKPNCVPCCKACNQMKHTYTAEQFIDHCKRVAIAFLKASLTEECDAAV